MACAFIWPVFTCGNSYWYAFFTFRACCAVDYVVCSAESFFQLNGVEKFLSGNFLSIPLFCAADNFIRDKVFKFVFFGKRIYLLVRGKSVKITAWGFIQIHKIIIFLLFCGCQRWAAILTRLLLSFLNRQFVASGVEW